MISRVDMQIITALGHAIYGQWWQRHVARELGVHCCTIGRWRRGVGGPKAEHLHRLLLVAQRRNEAIGTAYDAGLDALRQMPRPGRRAAPATVPESERPWWMSRTAKPTPGRASSQG